MRRFDQEWQLLVAALKWLRDRGYRLLDSRGPEGMEQGFDVYAGEQLGIRIVADRGQWFLEVHPGADGRDAVGWEGLLYADRPSRWSSRVDPSMSVNRNVTVPVGGADITSPFGRS